MLINISEKLAASIKVNLTGDMRYSHQH